MQAVIALFISTFLFHSGVKNEIKEKPCSQITCTTVNDSSKFCQSSDLDNLTYYKNVKGKDTVYLIGLSAHVSEELEIKTGVILHLQNKKEIKRKDQEIKYFKGFNAYVYSVVLQLDKTEYEALLESPVVSFEIAQLNLSLNKKEVLKYNQILQCLKTTF